MIRDLILKTYKMEELILEEEDIPLVLKIWDIYFKCLWEEEWAEWVEWVEEEEEEAEAEDSQVLISILAVQVKANNLLSDLAEKL
jgi:hypothetical protein